MTFVIYIAGSYRFTTQGRSGPNGVLQTFVVPSSGCYVIETNGGKGGDSDIMMGGYGAAVKATVCSLVAGQRLTVVGQRGENSKDKQGAGGGGGSFVYDESKSTPLLYIAAGGGGGCEELKSLYRTYNNSGQSSKRGQDSPEGIKGGSNGAGGSHANEGGAGAGWLTAGQTGSKAGPGRSRIGGK